MVKNKVGGNKAKKFARKNINENSTIQRKIRFVNDENELYGVVIKMNGNGQFNVFCIDGIERLCFIRNKFSGRNKQSNLITRGSWVIVGKRDWETPNQKKMEKCDLLEIYTDNEKHKLLQECSINLTILQKQENIILNNDSFNDNQEDNIVITNNEVDEDDLSTNYTNKNTIDDIDFDDI